MVALSLRSGEGCTEILRLKSEAAGLNEFGSALCCFVGEAVCLGHRSTMLR